MKRILLLFLLATPGFSQCQDAECLPGVEYPYYPSSVDDSVYISMTYMSGIDCPNYGNTECPGECVPDYQEGSGCDFSFTVFISFADLHPNPYPGTEYGFGFRAQDSYSVGTHDCVSCTEDESPVGILSVTWGEEDYMEDFEHGMCCGTYDVIRTDILYKNVVGPIGVHFVYQSAGEYGKMIFTCTDCDGEEVYE